jgi:hypothetical protein
MKSLLVKATEKGFEVNELSRARFLEMHKGKFCDLIPREPKRTLSQNALYWVYLNIIEQETGNNADELHEFFKRKFLKPKQVKVLGEEFQVWASTTKLSKTDFSEYMMKIEALTNVPVPSKEDAETMGYILNR